MDAIGVDDACTLLKHSKTLGFKGHVNIFGRVVAVSEIFRVKSDLIAMVSMKGTSDLCMPIMVLGRSPSGASKKDVSDAPTLHHLEEWRGKLRIGEAMVISRLKLTVVFKGKECEQIIFRGDSLSSCVLNAEKQKVCMCSLEDWFYVYLKRIVSSKDLAKSCPDVVRPIHLTEIVGEVTSCEDSIHGIYELDKSKRLFLTRIPAEGHFTDIKPGAVISVWVHHLPTIFDEVEVMFGCIHSSLQVVKKLEEKNTAVPFRPSSSSIASMLHDHNISNKQLFYIYLLERSIVERFQLHSNRKLAGTILHTLLRKEINGQMPLQSRDASRNITLEFLENKCLESQGPGLALSIPCIAHILDVFSMVTDDTMPDSDQGLSVKYKNSSDFDPPMILLGVLKLNKMTGQIELRDQSGSVDVVMSDKGHGDLHFCSDISGNMCSDECCPYVQTWHVDHFVRIDIYELVREEVVLKTGAADSKFKRCYVQVSARDMIICDNYVSTGMKKLLQPSVDIGQKRKIAAIDFERNNHVQTVFPKRMYTSQCVQGNETISVPSSQIGVKLKSVDLDQVGSSCEVLLILHKESIQFRPNSQNQSELFFNLSGLRLIKRRQEVKPQVVNCHEVGVKTQDVPYIANLQAFEKQWTFESSSLNLMGAQIKDYQVLHVNCLYTFTVNSPQNVFISTVPSILKGKKVSKVFTLNEGGHVERIVDPDDLSDLCSLVKSYNAEIEVPLTIRELIHDRSPVASSVGQDVHQSLVSVYGIVQSKSPVLQDKLVKHSWDVPHSGGEVSQEYNLSMNISSCDMSEEVRVEFPSRFPYPLGLLPGATVVIYRAARRKANGSDYLQFISLSCMSVIRHARQNVKTREKISGPPHMSIYSVRNVHQLTEAPFKCVVFISVILKITLTAVCLQCSSMFFHGKCSGRGCTSDAGHLKTEALFIGDDGTGKALVFCRGEVIQGLLGFSPEAWVELEEYLLANGGFFYDKSAASSLMSPVHQMLQEACESGHLCRPLEMCLKPALGLMQQRESIGLKRITEKDVPLKTVAYGQTRFETHQLPMIKLDCISILCRR